MFDVAIVQVFVHVSRLIEDLHVAGFAHRDLNPENVMWQYHTSCWVLIDFGFMTRLGKQCSVSFIPSYAAPEAMQLYINNIKTMVSSVQLWALGVMYLELMVGRSPFGIGAAFSQV